MDSNALIIRATNYNRRVPKDKQLPYAKYIITGRLDDLRRLLDNIEGVPSLPPVRAPSAPKAAKVNSIDTLGITELKNKARELGVIGYSKYNSSTINELRRKVLDKMNGVPQLPLVVNNLAQLNIAKPSPVAVAMPAQNNVQSVAIAVGPEQRQIISQVQKIDEAGVYKNVSSVSSVFVTNNQAKPSLVAVALDRMKPSPVAVAMPQAKPIVPRNHQLNVIPERYDPYAKGHCLTTNPQRLQTSAFSDYDNLTIIRKDINNINDAYKLFGVSKEQEIGKGVNGITYLAPYKGAMAIIKFNFYTEPKYAMPLDLGRFKWEVVISRRAGILGVGPEIFDAYMLYKNNVPYAGVITMKECTPLKNVLRQGEKNTIRFNKGEAETIPLRFRPQLREAIDKLHNNGIAHRDIHPGNIMFSGDNIVLIDYGYALCGDGSVHAMLKLFDIYLVYMVTGDKDPDKTIFDRDTALASYLYILRDLDKTMSDILLHAVSKDFLRRISASDYLYINPWFEDRSVDYVQRLITRALA